jgi:hypothetical protein
MTLEQTANFYSTFLLSLTLGLYVLYLKWRRDNDPDR